MPLRCIQKLYISRHEQGYTGPGPEAYPKKLNHRGFLWEKYKLVPSDEDEEAEDKEEEEGPADEDPPEATP